MVDAKLFESYRTALGSSADMARICVENLVANHSGELTIDELGQVYRGLVKKLGAYAAQVALEFYRDLRELAQVEEEYEARAYAPDDAGLLAYDVRHSSREQLPGVAVQRVLQYADETIYRNSRADPAHPVYAVVPHPGACGWCLMVGSQSWGYRSLASAENQRHPNCKCTVVADFDTMNPSLDGYDPRALRGLYGDARKAVKDDAAAEWAEMSEEQQSKYSRKRRSAYDVFLTKRIAAEITRRSNSK